EAGARFYTQAERILQSLDDAVSDLRDWGALRSGRVRVAASTVISSGLLSPAFKEFKNRWPNIRLVLHDVAEEEIVDMVLRGGVDFGIGTCNELPAGLEQTPLFDDHFIALFHREHPMADKEYVAWKDLEGLPFIALAQRSPIRRLIDGALHNAGIELNIVN